MHFSQSWYITAKRNLIVDYLLSLMFINLPINFPRWLYHTYPTFGQLFLKHFVAGLRNMFLLHRRFLDPECCLAFIFFFSPMEERTSEKYMYNYVWHILIVTCIYKEKVSKNLLIIKLDSYHVSDLHTCETRKILHT